MSRTPFFYIEIYNDKAEKWEYLNLLAANKSTGDFKPVTLWPWNGTHDLFSILNGDLTFPIFSDIRHRFPSNASSIVRHHYKDCSWEWDYQGETHISTPDAFYFTLADALCYLHDYPMVKDYDAMDEAWAKAGDKPWSEIEDIMMVNPISDLITRVLHYIEFADEFGGEFLLRSEIRIIGWIL